jgi:hypothetical protein
MGEMLKYSNQPGWWYVSIIPALRKQRQEDLEFEVSLGCIGRLSQNKQTTTEEE